MVKRSEAQIRAKERYDKATAKQVLFRFNVNTDADVIEKLEDVDNKQGYIKQLIRDDMKKN